MGELKTAAFGNRHTPRQLLIDALEKVEKAKMAVLIYVDENDYIISGWSDGSLLKRIGMLDVAKLRMIESGSEDEPV